MIGNSKITYRVSDLEQILTLIIPHFLKYPLKTKKRVDFELFAKSAQLISKKEHLTEEGLKKLVAIRASINQGLSELLRTSFPSCIPVEKPQFTREVDNLHPQ